MTISPSPEVSQGILIKKVEPKYPRIAKAAGIQGIVELQATIGKDGHITNLHVISGPDLLKDEALKAVKKWVYKPYILNGAPVELQVNIKVNFSLENTSHGKK